MKNRLVKIFKSEQAQNIYPSIIAIFIGVLFGLLIMLISNPSQAMGGFMTLLFGGFTFGARDYAQVINIATPIILTGLSVGFAFKTGLFNIGASGQFIVGGFVAVLIGVKMPSLGSVQWLVAIIGGAIAGGLWALIPGMFKAFFNVNEVISSIMMNYIGTYTVNMCVQGVIYDKTRVRSLPVMETAEIPGFGISSIIGSKANGGIMIAVLVVIIVYIILYKTTFGYELIACGYNKEACNYAGINAKKNIVLSMVIAGALAGLGGSLAYLSGTGKYIDVIDVVVSEGFNGIPVALLGFSNPIAILFAALFIAYLTVGGFMLQLYSFNEEVTNIIVASIIYFSAFSLIIKNIIEKRTQVRRKKISNVTDGMSKDRQQSEDKERI